MSDVTNDAAQVSVFVRIRRAFLPEERTVPSLLAVSGGIIAIATAYLYFTGFIYSYFFFDRFGVSLESLDLSSQYYLVHSYSVLGTAWGTVVGGLLVVIIYLCALGKLKQWVLIATLLGTFPILFQLSYRTAVSASEDLRRRPVIEIQLRFKSGETAETQPALSNKDLAVTPIGKQDHLWLLFESKDRLLVFAQPVDAKMPGALLRAEVYTVSRSDIQWSVVVVQ
jgi:hypothetical protein